VEGGGGRARRGLDVLEVRLALLRERRRQRDQDRVRLGELSVVERRRDPARVDVRLQGRAGDVLDVALADVQRLDELGHRVDEQHPAARVRERLRERHADVAGADDGDVPGPLGHGREAYRAARSGPPERR
jgi:hypothetical protein